MTLRQTSVITYLNSLELFEKNFTTKKVVIPKIMLPHSPMNIRACLVWSLSISVAMSIRVKEKQQIEAFIITMIQPLNLSILAPTRSANGITRILLIIIIRLTASSASFCPSLVSGYES